MSIVYNCVEVMSAIIVIPARYESSRFPGKPLASLMGKPMIQHVYENSKRALKAEDVIVATDDERIYETVCSFGGKAVMTSKKHATGTDRIAEVARVIGYDIIVNVQGDEPLVRPQMIDDVIGLLDDTGAHIGTLVRKITSAKELTDPHVVKVVFNGDGYALYFSRAPIPYHRDEWRSLEDLLSPICFSHNCHKHIGIYSYRREVLLRFAALKASRLEDIEKLEQLRALEQGLKVKITETSFDTIGVDVPGDLARVEQWLSLYS
jgi:3-deoxy-manno-octulosonate cytidylyltransferase (CMP-KDO synthetase)